MTLRTRRLLIAGLTAAALLVVLAPAALTASVRMRVLSALRQVLGIRTALTPPRRAPDARTRDLEAELARAEVRIRSLEEELARTRSAAGFVRSSGIGELHPIAARVVARGSRWSPDVVFLDAGHLDGVLPGSAVVAGCLAQAEAPADAGPEPADRPEGEAGPAADAGPAPDPGPPADAGPVYAIGVVVAVGPRLSRVALLGAREVRVPARLAKSGLQGMVEGSGGEPEMRYVPARDERLVGEPVLTTGLGGVFPAGLCVGRVSASKRETGRPFFRLAIEPAVEREALGPVLVIGPLALDLPPAPGPERRRRRPR